MSSLLRDRYAAWIAADILAMKGVEQENRHLDFKLLAKPDFGTDDQRHLAKAVSGFANAEGGVIVWGVDARRDPKDDYIDQVVATPGVDNPRQVLAKLNGLSSDATSPGLHGLDHRILEGGEGTPSFVATFVPEGESGPYMAMLGEARHRYYRRIGSAFSPMDHSMVADMFGRRPKPALQLQIVPMSGTTLSTRVILTNTGRGIAHATYLLVKVTAPLSAWVIDGHPMPYRQAASGWHAFAADYNGVLHPGHSHDWLALRAGFAILSPHDRSKQYVVDFRYGAAGIPEVTGRLRMAFEPPSVYGHERLPESAL